MRSGKNLKRGKNLKKLLTWRPAGKNFNDKNVDELYLIEIRV